MEQISMSIFREILASEKNNDAVDFINVCTPAEYNESYIKGVCSVPLDKISEHIHEFTDKERIYVHYKSGRRAAKAIDILESLGVRTTFVNVEGGISAWKRAGFTVENGTSRTIPTKQRYIL